MQLLREKLAYQLFDLFNFIGSQELKIEKKREELARHEDFEAYSAFKRIVRMGDTITNRDICLFLKDNKCNYVSEDDCKFVVKYYDSDNDAGINFIDFNYIVLVNDDAELRAKQVQQSNEFNASLNPDIEQTLAELFEMELNYHIQIDKMKRQLEQMKGFSTVTAFQIMDIKKFNYLDWDSIFYFLKAFAGSNRESMPSRKKVNAIFRRLDLNADVKIAFNEFAEAIKPIDVYFTEYNKRDKILGEEQKKISTSQLQQLKKELKKEYIEKRNQQKAKPLRTFKSILNSSNNNFAKQELSSPVKKRANEIMINSNGGQGNLDQVESQQQQSPATSKKQSSALKIEDQLDSSTKVQENEKQQSKPIATYVQNPDELLQQRQSSQYDSQYSPLQISQIRPNESSCQNFVSTNQRDHLSIMNSMNTNSNNRNSDMKLKAEDLSSEYSPLRSSLRSYQEKQTPVTKLVPHYIGKPEDNIVPKKEQQDDRRGVFKAVQSRDIKDQASDYCSPERYTQDQQQLSNVRYDMRVSMEKQHKNYPFSKLLVQILDSLKVIENEKELLYSSCRDFNVMDAFRAFDVDGKGYVTQLELTMGLMNLKISYTQPEIAAFCKYFDIDSSKKIKFSDFGKAFLPCDRDLALSVLKRDPKNIKRDKTVDQVFSRQTLNQYMLLWRIILRQTWEIENKKKQYQSSNCFDAERIFFDIDSKRRGAIDKDDFRQYVEDKNQQVKLAEKEVELLYQYFNRKELSKLTLDDFTAELIVY